VNPYYSDDLVTLYHGDCREVTGWLDADVLVTDPPYGVKIHANHRQQIQGDNGPELRDAAIALWGAVRPALVFGRWDIPRPAGTHERLIWDKNLIGRGNLRKPWGRSDEEVYVLGEWPPVRPGGRAREGGTPSRSSNVLRVQAYAPGPARPDHPTPKPPALMVRLIDKCPPGVVADPFAGSGSTLVAARQLGRRVVGVEVEERYCELIATRLSEAIVEPMFEVAL
jgi:site-specific DNA-methyltransferase (adenine-specific)